MSYGRLLLNIAKFQDLDEVVPPAIIPLSFEKNECPTKLRALFPFHISFRVCQMYFPQMASTGLSLFFGFLFLISSTCSNIVPQDDVIVVPAANPPPRIVSLRFSMISADVADFLESVVETFSVILVSELGDNTFFIAAIMAVKYSRMVVFLGAMSAVVITTFLAILCGWAVSGVPQIYLYYCSLIVMWTFGIKMIVDSFRLPEGEEPLSKDYTNVPTEGSKTPANKDHETSDDQKLIDDPESGCCDDEVNDPAAVTSLSIFAEAFALSFVGEWGDRSQFATVVLTWNDNKCGIMLGSVLAHCVTTGLAVICGRFVARKISVRKVSLVGGVVFILFSFITFFKNNDVSFVW